MEIGADVVALGDIIDISMKRFRATVPLGGYRSYQGLTQIKLFFYNVIDGQAAGECECEALINSKRTGVVNPAAHVPLEKEYFFLGEAQWGTQEFHGTLVGQSVGECLHQLSAAVEDVVRPVPELTVSEPKIIDVDGVQAYINVGSADGAEFHIDDDLCRGRAGFPRGDPTAYSEGGTLRALRCIALHCAALQVQPPRQKEIF